MAETWRTPNTRLVATTFTMPAYSVNAVQDFYSKCSSIGTVLDTTASDKEHRDAINEYLEHTWQFL